LEVEMPATVNITRYRGDTYRIRFTFTDLDTGDPIDLTGSSLLLTVNPVVRPDDTSEQLFQLTGSIQAPATDGVCDFTPNATQADNVGEFYYDVEMTAVDSSVRTLVAGEFNMLQDITK
jgi:hypothetical protein